MKTSPNFLVIGAVRSGTTLLHSYLLQHPEIFVPKNKRPEPHFFLKTAHFEKGKDWYHQTHFADVSLEKAIGEISTSYLFGEKVPERIFEYNEKMKFVAILREPKQRAFSNYWHSHKNGFEDLPFDEALRSESLRNAQLDSKMQEIAPYSYVGRSLYSTQFERYLKYFNKNQFYVCLFEDFISNTVSVLNELCEFLEVEKSFEWELISEKQNKSMPEQAQISNESMTLLREKFEKENSRLAELFDLNLSKWN